MKLSKYIDEFLNYLSLERGLSSNTISAYKRDLEKFGVFLIKKRLTNELIPKRDDFVSFIYELKDQKETTNVAKKESKALREFMALLKKYLKLLRSMKGKTSKMDKNLERELKSLGYLEE